MVEIDSDKLIKAIQQHPTFGTGTLSETAQSNPDELQRLIAREEGTLEFVEKIEGLLNITIRKLPEIENIPVEVEKLDIVDDKQDVHEGEIEKSNVELPAEPNEILPAPTEFPATPIKDNISETDVELESKETKANPKNETLKESEEEGKSSSPPVEIELTPVEVTNLPLLEIDCNPEQMDEPPNIPAEDNSQPEKLKELNYQILARTLSILKIRRRFGTEGFDYRKMLVAEQSAKKPRKSLMEMLEKCIKESDGNHATN